jgi:hypothetical protein
MTEVTDYRNINGGGNSQCCWWCPRGLWKASLQLAWEWYLRLFVKVSLVYLMEGDAHPHPVEQIARGFGRKLFKDVSQAYASSLPAVYAIAVSRNGANWR